MKRFTLYAVAAATLLILSGCSAPTTSSDATNATDGPVATETPTTTPTPTAEASGYGPCPDGLLNAHNFYHNTTKEVTWSEMNLPEGVDAPVASCVLMDTSSETTTAYYVGADQELADQLNKALSDAGLPPHVNSSPPNNTMWGSDDSGEVGVYFVIEDTGNKFIGGSLFTEPFVMVEVQGNPES